MKAVNFSLPDQNNKIHTLADYKGQWVVVYFYPRDDTPGCTKEACGFRDKSQPYKDQNIVILGISKDSVASHKKFAEKYHLTFPLLSDESKDTIKAYDAWGEKKFLGKTFEGVLRKTFLIDPEGEIRKTYDKVDVLNHAETILQDIKGV
ncbi:thioredoxin-dependent thiol peroxidase [Candidatus Roizmanbacteria bacterium]|nr:thioredoxin-dependent thiol peroxidase [Candidatus Roizmanbacteria bacterium]